MSSLMKKESAVIIGLLVGLIGAASTAVAQATVDGQVNYVTAAALVLPPALGLLIRFGVFSPATAEEIRKGAEPVANSNLHITINGQDVDVDEVATKIMQAIDGERRQRGDGGPGALA
jgi:hypothetical protein